MCAKRRTCEPKQRCVCATRGRELNTAFNRWFNVHTLNGLSSNRTAKKKKKQHKKRKKETQTNRGTHQHQHTHTRSQHTLNDQTNNESILCGEWELSRRRHNVFRRRESRIWVFVVKNQFQLGLGVGSVKEKAQMIYTKKYKKKTHVYRKHLTSEQWTSNKRTKEWTKRGNETAMLKRMRIKEFFPSSLSFFWSTTGTVCGECVCVCVRVGFWVCERRPACLLCLNDEYVAFDGRTKSHISHIRLETNNYINVCCAHKRLVVVVVEKCF